MTRTRTRDLRIILILGALSTVSPFSIDMYLPAFPQIAHDLGTTPSEISLSVAGYFIGLAAGQLFYGPLLDRFGRKLPIYAGLVLFIIACLGCLAARSPKVFIAARLLQALGGCAAQVGSTAMVRDYFPVERKRQDHLAADTGAERLAAAGAERRQFRHHERRLAVDFRDPRRLRLDCHRADGVFAAGPQARSHDLASGPAP